MELTVADLQHFATCPQLYWYARNREDPYMTWYSHFDACMHRLWTGLALQVQAGETPPLHVTLKRWGLLYYPRATKESILGRTTGGARWHDPDRSLFMVGVVAIKNGYETWLKQLQNVLLAGQEWLIPYGTHLLKGRYDLVTREDGEEVLWDLRFHTVPQRRNLRVDWEITAMVAAYRRDFGKLPDRIRVYEVILGDIQDTRRTSGDFALLRQTVEQVISLIEQGISYRAYSYQCESCPFYRQCYSDYISTLKRKR